MSKVPEDVQNALDAAFDEPGVPRGDDSLKKADQLSLFDAPKPTGPRPPGTGWQPIPGGRKGGFRRRKGAEWEYWYPDTGVQKPAGPKVVDKPELAEAVELFTEAAKGKKAKKAGPRMKHKVEVGEHVWGSRADKASLRGKDLEELDPVEAKKIVKRDKLSSKYDLDTQIEMGDSPGAVILKEALRRNVTPAPEDSAVARAVYADGIDFLLKSLDRCKTTNEIAQFTREWGELIRGRRFVGTMTTEEMEPAKHLSPEERALVVTGNVGAVNPELLGFKNEVRLVWEQNYPGPNDDRPGVLLRVPEGSVRDLPPVEEWEPILGHDGQPIRLRFGEFDEHMMSQPSERELMARKFGGTKDDYSLIHDHDAGTYSAFRNDPDLLAGVGSIRNRNLSLDDRFRVLKEGNPYAAYLMAMFKTRKAMMAVTSSSWRMWPKPVKDAYTKGFALEKKVELNIHSPEEAAEAAAEALATKRRSKRGEVFKWVRRTVPNPVREGGRDTPTPSAETLAGAFDLKNVQFGNWVSDDDAKQHIAACHGALSDLQDILGVDPKVVSMNGRLSIGFGARGGGHFAAHYEPWNRIINLTKFAGGGSLAHEWAHAMDHIVAEVYRGESTVGDLWLSHRSSGAVPEDAKSAVNGLMGAIRDSKFSRDANILGDYWARPHEMYARAFEAYVEDRLTESGRKNTYLVTGTRGSYGLSKEKNGKLYEDLEMYPQGEDRRKINEAFDAMIATLRDGGHLAKAMRYLERLESRGIVSEVVEELRKAQQLAMFARPPGSGWEPIPKGGHGGFRRRKGMGYEYWYPGQVAKPHLKVVREPEHPTKTREFKEWFGDWEAGDPGASKVVKADGSPAENYNTQPIPVFHGTAVGGFRQFDPGKGGRYNLYGSGFYFTEDRGIAEEYTQKDSENRINSATGLLDADGNKVEYITKRMGERILHDTLTYGNRLHSDPYIAAALERSFVPGKGHNVDRLFAEMHSPSEDIDIHKYQPDAWERNVAAGTPLYDGARALVTQIRSTAKDMRKKYSFIVPKAQVFEVYLNVRNPVDMDAELSREDFQRFAGWVNHEGKGPQAQEPSTHVSIYSKQLTDWFSGRALGVSDDEGNQNLWADYDGLLRIKKAVVDATEGKEWNDRQVEGALRQAPVDKLTWGDLQYIFTDSHWSMRDKELFNNWAKAAGHDGIAHTGGWNVGTKDHKVWIAFEPTQIKATENEGGFDPNNPDIYKSQLALFAKPPGSGWQPIPGGKHGGFRRPKGRGGFEYWYPGETPAAKPKAKTRLPILDDVIKADPALTPEQKERPVSPELQQAFNRLTSDPAEWELPAGARVLDPWTPPVATEKDKWSHPDYGKGTGTAPWEDPEWVPDLDSYDYIVVNSSAGKDSQAQLTRMVELADKHGYPRDRIVVVHADLGRVEWEGTGSLAKAQAEHYGLRFEVVKRQKNDLLDQIEERHGDLTQRVDDTKALAAAGLGTWKELLAADVDRVLAVIGTEKGTSQWPGLHRAKAILKKAAKDLQTDRDKREKKIAELQERVARETAQSKAAKSPQARENARVRAEEAVTALKDQIAWNPENDPVDFGAPIAWPSPDARYCTSYHKTAEVNKFHTALANDLGKGGQVRILNTLGIRAQESDSRSKMNPFKRSRESRNVAVDNWFPIHRWHESKVWETIKASDIPYHKAYNLGMRRLSCVFCVYATKEDLMVAASHNKELFNTYLATEEKVGASFQEKQSLAGIREEIQRRRDAGYSLTETAEWVKKALPELDADLIKASMALDPTMVALVMDAAKARLEKAGPRIVAVTLDWKPGGLCVHLDTAVDSHHVEYLPYPDAYNASLVAATFASRYRLSLEENNAPPPE